MHSLACPTSIIPRDNEMHTSAHVCDTNSLSLSLANKHHETVVRVWHNHKCVRQCTTHKCTNHTHTRTSVWHNHMCAKQSHTHKCTNRTHTQVCDAIKRRQMCDAIKRRQICQGKCNTHQHEIAPYNTNSYSTLLNTILTTIVP